jgi:cytidylate kinase
MSEIWHISIDGPAASGKGTVAAGISRATGLPCLDTGAMYRGVAVHFLNGGNLENLRMDVRVEDNKTKIFLNNIEVTDKLRTNEVSMKASEVGTMMNVRKKMIEMQREISKKQSFILEGRDIGSVVLPNAKYKFYLDASIEVRAARRAKELNGDYNEIFELIKKRDKTDREKGGFQDVPDAIYIDTSAMSVQEVIDRAVGYIKGDSKSFNDILGIITSAQERAFRAVRREQGDMYWQIGEYVSKKVKDGIWGKSIVNEMSNFLQQKIGGRIGFSPSNIWRMKQFYEMYVDNVKLAPLVREISWTNKFDYWRGQRPGRGISNTGR